MTLLESVTTTTTASELIEHFTTGTDPLWGAFAALLFIAAAYMRILSRRSYPNWVWRFYLFFALLIFLINSSDVYIEGDLVLIIIELLMLGAAFLGSLVLFYFIVTTDPVPTLREIVIWFLAAFLGLSATTKDPEAEDSDQNPDPDPDQDTVDETTDPRSSEDE